MKFNTEQLNILSDNLEGFFKESGKTKNEWAEIYANSGRSATRFLLDAFYATGLCIGDGVGMSAKEGRFASGTITIPDCNDSHIETALKRVIGRQTLKAFMKS